MRGGGGQFFNGVSGFRVGDLGLRAKNFRSKGIGFRDLGFRISRLGIFSSGVRMRRFEFEICFVLVRS